MLIYRILDMISRVSVFVLLFCLFFTAGKTVISWVIDLKSWGTIGRFYIYELVLAVISFLYIYFRLEISSPWEKFIKGGDRP